MLQHRGHTLIIGGRRRERECDGPYLDKLYKLDLETNSAEKIITKMSGFGEARSNHFVFTIPYGYLTKCKGDFIIIFYYYFSL